MKKFLMMAAFAALLTAPAFANEAKFKEADTDGNGSLSRAEWVAMAEAKFAKADANGDGQVTMDEKKAFKDHDGDDKSNADDAGKNTNAEDKGSGKNE